MLRFDAAAFCVSQWHLINNRDPLITSELPAAQSGHGRLRPEAHSMTAGLSREAPRVIRIELIT